MSDRREARASIDVLHEISSILNTGLDRKTLSILVELVESGVNPEALAAVVKELRREAAILKEQT
ncbi:unnamed protein product [Discosporangium mesarthrocarpum]